MPFPRKNKKEKDEFHDAISLNEVEEVAEPEEESEEEEEDLDDEEEDEDEESELPEEEEIEKKELKEKKEVEAKSQEPIKEEVEEELTDVEKRFLPVIQNILDRLTSVEAALFRLRGAI